MTDAERIRDTLSAVRRRWRRRTALEGAVQVAAEHVPRQGNPR